MIMEPHAGDRPAAPPGSLYLDAATRRRHLIFRQIWGGIRYCGLVDDHLERARDTLDRHGVISALNKIIAEVYTRNAARHDPVLGDDATTFGITTSRNIANLAVLRLKDQPGVRARLVDTALEVLCGGYVVRQYKLPGVTRDVSVDAISWENSEAKLNGAIENSAAGQLTLDIDLEEGQAAFSEVVPAMRHLRLAHASDLETGETVIYLGLPRDNRRGGMPWFDVAIVYGDSGSGGEQGDAGGTRGPVPAAGPSYDQLPLPDVGLARRTFPRRVDAQQDAGT